MRKLIPTIVLLLLAAGFSFGQSLSPEVKKFVKYDAPVIALTHVRIIDGTGAPAREDQTLILSKGKIESIGGTIPKDAQVLDLHGYTVIPGLVGMHDHLFYQTVRGVYATMPLSFPRLYLAGGVTTIRTTGSIDAYTDLEIKKAIDAGKAPGPKIHVTGPYLEGPGTSSVQLHVLSGPDEATKNVNYWLDEGADNFKAYMYITPQDLSAAVDAAHRRGAKVTGHLCTIGFREAAKLGIDDLEHGLLVDTEFLPWKKPDQCPEEPNPTEFMSRIDVEDGPVHDLILDLVQRHVAITSTLPVFEMFAPGRPSIAPRVLDVLSTDARNEFLDNKVWVGDTAVIQKRYNLPVSPWPLALRKEMEFEYAFVKAGGLLLAGEDPTGIGGVLAGFGDQREVELLVEARFTPVEAIHIATQNGAQYLGDADKVGTIAPGKQADLVVIKGDLSQRIDGIENVETVFKDGVGYDSAKLIESVRGQVGMR